MLNTKVRILIFCVSGLIISPFLLRDCAKTLPDGGLRTLEHTRSRHVTVLSSAYNIRGTYLPDDETLGYIEEFRNEAGITTHMDVQVIIQGHDLEIRDIPYRTLDDQPNLLSASQSILTNRLGDDGVMNISFDHPYFEAVQAEVITQTLPFRIRLITSSPKSHKSLTFVRANL